MHLVETIISPPCTPGIREPVVGTRWWVVGGFVAGLGDVSRLGCMGNVPLRVYSLAV